MFGRRSKHIQRQEDPRWDVELEGRRVGELSARRRLDMFWWSYAIRALEADPSIEDDELWNSCRFDFREERTGTLTTEAFAGGRPPYVVDGRVIIRGLHPSPARRGLRKWLDERLSRWHEALAPHHGRDYCCDLAKSLFEARLVHGEFLVASRSSFSDRSLFFSGFNMAHRHDYQGLQDALASIGDALTAAEISNIKITSHRGVRYCSGCGVQLVEFYGPEGGSLRDDPYVARLGVPPRAP